MKVGGVVRTTGKTTDESRFLIGVMQTEWGREGRRMTDHGSVIRLSGGCEVSVR